MEKKGEKSIKIAKDNLFHSNFFLESGDIPFLKTPLPLMSSSVLDETPPPPYKVVKSFMDDPKGCLKTPIF